MDYLREEQIEMPALDLDLVRQIVSLVEREDLSELILSQGQITVIVKGRNYRPQVSFSIPTTLSQVTEAIYHQPMEPEMQQQISPIPEERLFHITAPLTGVFYSRPRPDASPFVTVGSEVEPEQVVALVEAMKFFNEVKSEVRGKVREILAKDGQLVKHGDTLIVLERLD